jgi:hypothetical protein
MAKDTVSSYLTSSRKHNEPVLSDNESLVASLDLEYA